MKKIIALGVSAVSAATMAFGSINPAVAAEDPVSTVTDTICGVLPAQVTGLVDQLTAALGEITSAETALESAQAALPVAVNDLVDSIVGYIQAVDAGEGVSSAAQLVAARSSAYAEKVVAADSAANAWFAAQRAHFLTGLANQYMEGVQSGLCSAS
jgi:hypothetical protein